MDWQPKARIMAPTSPDEPPKPSEPCSVGFEGYAQAQISNMRGQLSEEVVQQVETTEAAIPAMPPGVGLIKWKLKEPPVAIETCAVVIAPALFAKATLDQLRVALESPKRWVGWSVPQLIDRLAQVGVQVALGPLKYSRNSKV
jgi:hypothetical protein